MVSDEAGSGTIARFDRVTVEDYQERVLAAYDRMVAGRWTSSTFAASLHMALELEAGPLSEWLWRMDRFADMVENWDYADVQPDDVDPGGVAVLSVETG